MSVLSSAGSSGPPRRLVGCGVAVKWRQSGRVDCAALHGCAAAQSTLIRRRRRAVQRDWPGPGAPAPGRVYFPPAGPGGWRRVCERAIRAAAPPLQHVSARTGRRISAGGRRAARWSWSGAGSWAISQGGGLITASDRRPTPAVKWLLPAEPAPCAAADR